MDTCEVCGNEFENPMRVDLGGQTHIFDSFECAIHALAPRCEHCQCRIIGHGIQAGESIYCCAHCAGEQGAAEARDHV